MFDFLTRNFVVISAIIVAIASTLTMLFLVAYLSLFDWSLIWLIEYSDLTKFFLLAAALLSVLALLSIQFLPQLDLWMNQNLPYRRWFLAALILVFLGQPLYSLYSDFRAAGSTPQNAPAYSGLKLACYIAALGTIWAFVQHRSDWKKRNWHKMLLDIGLVGVFVGLLGITFAVYVKDESTLVRTITTKAQTYKNAKIILLLSHHIAFAEGNRVIVVPTAEITEMVSTQALSK
ncbi:MAG: hypothetical protein Q7V17_13835 [Afipia sp.]|nr:hypothetical protein [Afipia sp.]